MHLFDLVLPVPCVACGVPGAALCPACLAALEPAEPFSVPAGLDTCATLTTYRGAARQVIIGAKYRNDRSALGVLSKAAAQCITDVDFDVVCWVPTVPSHRRGRGFDQGELLARMVGRSLRRPTRRLLTRLDGPGQTGRSRATRAGPTPFVARRAVPTTILLVDDVVTTGATFSAAARELRRAGALEVHGLALAHTPPPS